MPPATDWRSKRAADEMDRTNRDGFAAEFLRRNQSYRKDYARLIRRIAAGAASEEGADADFARRWRLSFRL
jgi:hypothetical protein